MDNHPHDPDHVPWYFRSLDFEQLWRDYPPPPNFAHMTARLSRDELRAHLASGNNPTPAPGLQPLTYKGGMTVHMNGDDIQLIAVPNAHTDGDTMVYFPKADVLMTGDFYRSIQFPNIDRANGGSAQGMLDGLGWVIGQAGANTKIIPGHGATVGRNEVEAHRDMMLAIKD